MKSVDGLPILVPDEVVDAAITVGRMVIAQCHDERDWGPHGPMWLALARLLGFDPEIYYRRDAQRKLTGDDVHRWELASRIWFDLKRGAFLAR